MLTQLSQPLPLPGCQSPSSYTGSHDASALSATVAPRIAAEWPLPGCQNPPSNYRPMEALARLVTLAPSMLHPSMALQLSRSHTPSSYSRSQDAAALTATATLRPVTGTRVSISNNEPYIYCQFIKSIQPGVCDLFRAIGNGFSHCWL